MLPLVQVYVRAMAFGDVTILALCVLPIVVKWALIERWTPQEIQIWSLAYVRFWIVKTLVRANPLLLMIGGRSRSSTTSPILNFYLRALGAKIGPGVAIFTRTLPYALTCSPSGRTRSSARTRSSPATGLGVGSSRRVL